ncbi:MAG: hypothetical protein K2J36_06160 [Ruminococcus sp.]|nr:hypothetical protein [Ruminococcus sp.]MDE6797577.1 hypothetical protein [Ruminococcus sp.]
MSAFRYNGRFGENADIPPEINKNISVPDYLSGAGLDSDRLLVLALMILLAKDGADMKLLLALGYILL